MAKNQKIIGKERITREVIEREISSEYEDDYTNVVLPKRHRLENGRFITLFQDMMLELVKAKLSKNELQMLFYLIGSAGAYNSINIDLDTLCKELGDYKSNVSKTLGLLVNKNIIIRATTKGAKSKGQTNIFELSVNFDRLNYRLAYNGNVKKYQEVKGKDPRLSVDSLDKRQLSIPFSEDALKSPNKDFDIIQLNANTGEVLTDKLEE